MVTPAIETERIIQLDALRGLAVIGIVWMNVLVFAMPGQSYYNPAVWGPGIGAESAADRFVWTASFVFVESKFRTLFAMLFGAGCLILIERAQQSGASNVWRAHYARMAVLFAIGFAHAVFFASNDILRIYAMAGLLLPLIARLSAPALYAIAIGLVAAHVGAGIVTFGGAVVDFYAGREGTDAALFAERVFGASEPAVRASIDVGREAFGERIERRLDGIGAQLRSLALSVPLNLGAMALGMASWKSGMFKGEWRTFRLQRLAAICAVVALPALLALAWWVSDNGFPGALAGSAGAVWSAPFDTLLALSYAALAMAFFAPGGAVIDHLASVGRLALSNYVMTSVILSAIFASWGLGLFGHVSRLEAFALSFVPIAAMVAWSPGWVARLGQGPLERSWRKAAKVFS